MLSFFRQRDIIANIEKKRQKNAKKGDYHPNLHTLYHMPLPSAHIQIDNIDFVVLDIETTGLNASQDQILSIGYVEIQSQQVKLNLAAHCYIASSYAIKPETAIINHIVPQDLSSGQLLSDVLWTLLPKLAGKILIAHGALIEYQFIKHALWVRQHRTDLPFIWLDTMRIEKSLFANRNRVDNDYRLSEIRKRYQLPDYLTHNALSDAIATAELFLVQIKHLFGHEPVTLKQLLPYSLACY